MPAAIEADFSKKHLTKAEKEKKEKEKASVTPSVKLKVPDKIKNNVQFYNEWKNVLKFYKGTQLLNALDADMLARYCIEKCSMEGMYELRDRQRNVTALLDESIDKLSEIVKDRSIKDEIGQANFSRILDIIAIGMDRFGVDTMLKIETRIEAKTKMLNQMALALYMTPRARAGAVPNQPDKEAKDDPNADMFD
ncbi:hypothetical protein [Desulfosporosinus sp. SB140]|uniref:hypothetical protein n=1 Tax=Desulfosporosinus paludis TaxID=3115649 RepID=UPI00388FED6C